MYMDNDYGKNLLNYLDASYFEEFKKNKGFIYIYSYPNKETLENSLKTCQDNVKHIEDELKTTDELIDLSKANTDKYILQIQELMVEINDYKKQISNS